MGSWRILVVDDEPEVVRTIAAFLQSAAYEVVTAGDGVSALSIVAQMRVDLVLLDVRLPGMDGLTVLRRLREQSATRLLPVVILTGMTQDVQNTVQGLDAGADDFLYKPVELLALLAKVRTLLRVKEAQDEIQARTEEIERLNQELSRKNAELERYKQHTSQEMEMARNIQLALLPNWELSVDGLALACRYKPCEEVGGDFFDYALLDDRLLNLVLADVSGHGLPAAIVVSLIKALCHRELRETVDPPHFLQKLNELLQRGVENRYFATACFLQMDVAERKLRYSNGGHPPFLIQHRGNGGAIDVVRSPSPLLGLWDNPRFDVFTYGLQPGDRILLYTDGVVDRQAPDLQNFELGRLKDALAQAVDKPIGECLDHITQCAEQFGGSERQRDDCALVGLDVL